MKNWEYTHNFHDTVDIISQCGGKEITSHIIKSSTNAIYMPLEFISKYFNSMAKFVKKSLQATMKDKQCTLYSNETQNITSTEQIAIYTTFTQGHVVKEYFICLIPISKVVQTHLFAMNIMGALEHIFKDLEIPLRNAKSKCMDTTNVDSGEQNDFKQRLVHILRWIGCNNHKLVLCFQHLIPKFPIINKHFY